MNEKLVIALAVAAVIGGVVIARRNAGGADESEPSEPNWYEFSDPAPEPDAAQTPSSGGFFDWFKDSSDQLNTEVAAQIAPMPELANPSTNVAAFLKMIKQAEGTDRAGDPYRVCYAYKHTIQSFNDHPAITGEWRGEPLSAAMCAGAGLSAGCVSTAAGAYQIIKPTWVMVKAKLGLTDFSPASQDAAAVELIRQRGALGLVERGKFADAIYACRKEWASLAGAGYGQGERSLEWLEAKFTAAGGVVSA